MLRILIVAVTLSCLTITAVAQTQPLAFEVATVKPSPPPAGNLVSFGICHGIDSQFSGLPADFPIPAQGRCLFKRVTLRGILALAYPSPVSTLSVNERFAGGPGWAASDDFDIEGKADAVASVTNAQLLSMLRQLLTDRFKLHFHMVPREVKGFALRVAKSGHKLKAGTGDFEGFMANEGGLSATNAPMTGLARMLSTILKVTVLDETGLKGGYAFSLPRPNENDASAPALFTVLPEVLGLRLESTNVAVDVIVIDHVEKPSEN